MSRSKLSNLNSISFVHYSYNPEQNILEFETLTLKLWNFEFTTRYFIFIIKNLLYRSYHQLPNSLRYRISGNQDLLKKFQNWLEMESSMQSSFQKWYFCNSSKTSCRSSYQSFLLLSNFARYFYFAARFLFRIVDFPCAILYTFSLVSMETCTGLALQNIQPGFNINQFILDVIQQLTLLKAINHLVISQRDYGKL